MDITMIGLQNAGKTSLLRVLAVSPIPFRNYVRACDSPRTSSIHIRESPSTNTVR